MKNPLFTGVCTALVTPFLDGTVNYPMLEQLLHTVVLAGTTGESPTLSRQEKLEMFRRAKAFTGENCMMIAGTGSNDTRSTVELSIAAEEAGADGLLVVCPYYNKPVPDGILAHYQAVAESVTIPIIVYNVPSRTGTDIPVPVYEQLAQIDNIAGVKEASADIRKVTRICRNCPDAFSVWTGNDDLIVPAMAMGARGVVSVLSNVCPLEASAMTAAAEAGDFQTASAIQKELTPLIQALFCQSNPIPVKYILKKMGYDCGDPRLPLTPLAEPYQKQIQALFQ